MITRLQELGYSTAQIEAVTRAIKMTVASTTVVGACTGSGPDVKTLQVLKQATESSKLQG